MPQSGTCPKCGSVEVVPGARVVARSDGEAYVAARVDADPQATFFKHPSYVRLVARVCGKCGYAELYADEPSGLLSAWTKSQKG